jgi:hypothetical protein
MHLMYSTDTNKPYCVTVTATANAFSVSSAALVDLDYGPTTGGRLITCDSLSFDVNMSISASYSLPGQCAPPWATNPASLSAWSAANPSYAHDFGEPFAGLKPRNPVEASITDVSTFAFPTESPSLDATAERSPSATSNGGSVLLNLRKSAYIGGVLTFVSAIQSLL